MVTVKVSSETVLPVVSAGKLAVLNNWSDWPPVGVVVAGAVTATVLGVVALPGSVSAASVAQVALSACATSLTLIARPPGVGGLAVFW